MIQMNLQIRKRLMDLENARGQGGVEMECGERAVREFGMDMYTLLYLKWITNKDLLLEFCSMLCGSLDGKGVWGRMDMYGCICICIVESLHCSPETITTLLIGYTPTQNKKFKIKKCVAQTQAAEEPQAPKSRGTR